MTSPLTDFSRLCIHTITTKPWPLEECIENYVKAGVPAVSVWRQWLEPNGLDTSARMLKDSGLRITSLVRGGFFPAKDEAGRAAALDDNRKAIDEAAAIGAPLIVLVCGAVPGIPLPEARKQIADGIAAVLPYASAAGVKLAIEPLHPMYSDCRSAINTLEQASDIVEQLGDGHLGVTVDVYHLWWDPYLRRDIQRAGDTIFSFHVCDWLTPTNDMLNDRGLMGDGCIDIPEIRAWVEEAGFTGDIEVEIFSNTWWAADQTAFLDKIKTAYIEHC